MFQLYSRVHAHCMKIMASSLCMRAASVQRNDADDDHSFVYGNTSNVLNSNREDGIDLDADAGGGADDMCSHNDHDDHNCDDDDDGRDESNGDEGDDVDDDDHESNGDAGDDDDDDGHGSNLDAGDDDDSDYHGDEDGDKGDDDGCDYVDEDDNGSDQDDYNDDDDDNNDSDDDNEGNDDNRQHQVIKEFQKMVEIYITKGGCCKDNCLMNKGDLARRRATALFKLKKNAKKNVVFGMLAIMRDNSHFNCLGVDRTRSVYHYCLSWGTSICSEAFKTVVGISSATLKRWQSQLCSESDVAPSTHGNTGRLPHHVLLAEDIRNVTTFIRNYAATNGLPDPGRLQGPTREYTLDSSSTMMDVYNVYCQAMSEQHSAQLPQQMTSMRGRLYSLVQNVSALPLKKSPMRVVKYSTFVQLWHTHCKSIKIQPSRSDLCDSCDKMLVELRHSLSEETRRELNVKYVQHNRKAKLLRDHYNANITKSRREWRALSVEHRLQILSNLKSGLPRFISGQLAPSFVMQYSFDYCQQLTIPYSSQQRGSIYFRTPRKVQVFGVCCEELTRQVFFLTDEGEQIGKGAIVVVSQLHAFFHLHGLGERHVTLQSDNCAGQNKNQT